MLSLRAPVYLLLLIPVTVLALSVGRQLGGRFAGAGKHGAILALHCAGLALLILALCRPAWVQSSGPQVVTTYVVDTSASITASARASEVAWLRAALGTSPAGAARYLVTFAGSPLLTSLPANVDTQWLQLRLAAPTDASATDIESALRLALGATPDGGRLILMSDGLQTIGDAHSVLATATTRHIRIDTIVLQGQRSADAALTRLQTPQWAHLGDVVPVQLTVWSNRTSPATLSLWQDGQLLGKLSITLNPGENGFLVNLRALSAGWHTYHALIAMPGDTVSQNNALDSVTHVIAPPRLLVVMENPRQSAISGLLANLGLSARIVPPGAMPAKARTLESYDAVVLEDLPALALGARQVAALDQAVHGKGVGLFVLGGPHSLTLGRYSQTPLERLLPVLSDTPNSLQQGNVALQLVLDRSGSMADPAGDVPKIDMARAAADIAVTFVLQHQDEIGVESFDLYPHVLTPMQKVTAANKGHIRSVIAALQADGGTAIYQALKTGLAQIDTSTAPYKHIILMTDGRSRPGDYSSWLDQLAPHHVTLSTIGLGSDADVQLLLWLAARGKGRFYYTENARDLPHIFAEEARLSAGSARVTGTIGVAIGASSPLIRSLGNGLLPPIHGYVATVLKPGAVDDLVTQIHGRPPDPVLAHWQYGLGRVAVWTPGASASWAGTWTTSELALWDDMVRWVLRGADQVTLAPQRVSGEGSGSIVVDTAQNSGAFLNLAQLEAIVQPPTGTAVRVTLEQVGPGRYEGSLPDSGPGVYRTTVRQMGGSSAQAVALLAIPYAQEYLPRSPDRALLAQMAATAGGQVLQDPRQLGSEGHSGAVASDHDLWGPLLVVALVLFLIDVVLRQSDLRFGGAASQV